MSQEAEVLALLGALADETRLRVFAAALLRPGSAADLAAAASVRERDAVQALVRLERAGLIAQVRTEWTALPQTLQAAVAAATPQRPVVDHGAVDTVEATVLRTFMPAGRIVQMPAQENKRRIVLEQVARAFEPGVRYPERQVDVLLKAFADDYVTVRRYLIDYGLLEREAGVYWRIGGRVDV